MVATSAYISNKVIHKELLLINFSLGREKKNLSVAQSAWCVSREGPGEAERDSQMSAWWGNFYPFLFRLWAVS